MKRYCGIDLHSNNHVVTVIDEQDHRVYEKRLPNDLASTLRALEPYRTELEAIAVIRTMATRWSDEEIAATLNRMNLPTGQGKTWTAHRVGSLRRVRDIHAFKSAEKNGEWLMMREAAAKLGVSHHQIRRLIKEGALVAEQVVPGAPFQIRASDLDDKRVASALARKGRPCRVIPENQTSMFSNT